MGLSVSHVGRLGFTWKILKALGNTLQTGFVDREVDINDVARKPPIKCHDVYPV